jgi:hypothetical protein
MNLYKQLLKNYVELGRDDSDLKTFSENQLKDLKKEDLKRYIEDKMVIYNAFSNGHENIVEILLTTFGKDLPINEYVIYYASRNGHENIVEMLLKTFGKDLPIDKNAIKYASLYGHENIIKMLLYTFGKDLPIDENAIKYASQEGHDNIVKMLKDFMDDPDEWLRNNKDNEESIQNESLLKRGTFEWFCEKYEI